MTDNYEFMRSNQPQSADNYTPYVRKDWNHVPDINSGVYTNTSMSQVTLDLSSIFNSSRMVDTNDMFITLPIVLTAQAFTGANPGVGLDLSNTSSAITMLKSGYSNLIHQADLQINGKTIEQTQPFIGKFIDFKLLSEMSDNDLKSLGPSLGYSDELDNPYSVRWNVSAGAATAGICGNGISNNRPFGLDTAVGTRNQTVPSIAQYSNCVNTALSQRAGNYLFFQTAVTATGSNLLGDNAGHLSSSENANDELRSYVRLANGSGGVANGALVYFDVAVIRLRDLFDSMANIGLTKRFDAQVRLYVNTGGCVVDVVNPAAANCGLFASSTKSTFSNVCPIMANHIATTTGNLPANTARLALSCFLAKSPNSLIIDTCNVSVGASHSMPSCRCYYSSIEVKPQLSIKYVNENRNKRVVFRSVITNQTAKIEPNGSYNQLIQSGITHPLGLVILPFVDQSVVNSGAFGPGGSPFDSTLAHPISIKNLQVQVGGVNVLSNTLSYSFETFLEQVHLFESLTSSDLGVSCGLINKQFWDVNRTYFVNLARSTTSDNLTPRNVQVSFTGNTRHAYNCLMFLVYLDEFEIDVETGLVKK